MATQQSSLQKLEELLNEGIELTKYDAREKLGLKSEKQVSRLIAQLRENGVPVLERREGQVKVYYIEESERTQPHTLADLSDRQIHALAVAARASLAVLKPTPLGEPLRESFELLLKQMDSDFLSFDVDVEGENWYFGGGTQTLINADIFGTVYHAIQAKRCIWIDYLSSRNKQSTRRAVEPYALAARNGSWLMVAWCKKSNEFRDFSIAGISDIYTTDTKNREEFFTRREDFAIDSYFANRFGAMSGNANYTVRLQVDAGCAISFRRKIYHASQSIQELDTDGSLVVTFTVSGLKEILSFVLGWGDNITVLEPAELVAMVRGEIDAMAARYADKSKVLE